ncbi:MAG: UDP-3-O-acyl-N-acetylglucosamine deacetylase [Proteobacteria bacterium]|nr:UDP-3-O-acyl-N-acetylglucosamine deacetylase [Pseudomonadota bacterium]
MPELQTQVPSVRRPVKPKHAFSVRQKTLKSAIHCSGVGLHTGARVSMTLMPAEADSGICFRRTDAAGRGSDIPALWHNVVDSRLCTRLGREDGVAVATVEHLMAAFAGCEVDNAVVEVDGPEVPIMDGSAAPFVFLIECAGKIEQNAPRRAVQILRQISAGNAERHARLSPALGMSVSFDIDFDSPAVAKQHCAVHLVNGTFKSEISRARTFGFLHELDQLRAAGLARGGSLDNAVVVAGDRVLNEEGLRYDDEFVRHKVLDCIGDLYLAGGPMLGHFHGHRSGHHLTHQALSQLFGDAANWRRVEVPALDAAAAEPIAASA